MLAACRSVARPLAAILLALFIAPGAVAECREVAAATGDAMTCCKRGESASLTADCCAVDEAPPASERPSSTAAPTRVSSLALDAAPVLLPLGSPSLALNLLSTTAADHTRPDPIYLFLSIRR